MFPSRGTHVTRDMCFLGRGTYITRDVCVLGRGKHITRKKWVKKCALHCGVVYFFGITH